MQRKDVKITVVYMNVMNACDLEGWCYGLGAIYHIFFKKNGINVLGWIDMFQDLDTIEHCETLRGSALTATCLILRQARAFQYEQYEVIFIVDVT